MDMVERERRNRTRVALAALAYEIYDNPLMSDAEFDMLCARIDPTVDTGNPALDYFFETEFSPNTGSWVHYHPELDKLHALYKRLDTGPKLW